MTAAVMAAVIVGHLDGPSTSAAERGRSDGGVRRAVPVESDRRLNDLTGTLNSVPKAADREKAGN